jgi:hypothetical protein
VSISSPTIPTRAYLEQLFSRVDPVRGRLTFALDATASRQPTWDTAAQLQGQMFETVAAIGGLDVQLVCYRGYDECAASLGLSNPKALATIMSRVTWTAGHTQICKVLGHARKENAREKVNAVIAVSDGCEETPHDLYAQASELGCVSVFMFHEGTDKRISEIFTEIAKITGGAGCQFDSGAAQRLADLLKAVAAFAAGGIKGLAAQKSDAATPLLTQRGDHARPMSDCVSCVARKS